MRDTYPIYDYDKIKRGFKVTSEKLFTPLRLKERVFTELERYGQKKELDETRRQYLIEDAEAKVKAPKKSASYIRRITAIILVLATLFSAVSIYLQSNSGTGSGNGLAFFIIVVAPWILLFLLIYSIESAIKRKRAQTLLSTFSGGGLLSYAFTPVQKMWRHHGGGESGYYDFDYYIVCGGLTLSVVYHDYIKVDVGREFFVVAYDLYGKKYAEIV